MKLFSYKAGVLFGQSKWFASSTPLRFSISCVYLFLFVVLSWAILYNEFDNEFPSPPNFHIPFLGSPYEWASQYRIGATWTGFIALVLTWVGVVKIAARNHFGCTTPQSPNPPSPVDIQNNSTKDNSLVQNEGERPLYFKNGDTAFEMACKYGEHELGVGKTLIAIVIDARKEAGCNFAVKTLANGCQMAMLRVSSPDGGFVVLSETPSAEGPKLEVGDLVSWHIVGHSEDASGWVGLIVAKIKPEYSIPSGWKIDAIFPTEMVDQQPAMSKKYDSEPSWQPSKQKNKVPIAALLSVVVAAIVVVYIVQSHERRLQEEKRAVLVKKLQEQQREQEILRDKERERIRFSSEVLSNDAEIYRAIQASTPEIRWIVPGKKFSFVDPKKDPLGLGGVAFDVEQLLYKELKPRATGYPRRILVLEATPQQKTKGDYSCRMCQALVGIFVLSASYGKIGVDATNEFKTTMGGWGSYGRGQDIRLLTLGGEDVLLLPDGSMQAGISTSVSVAFGLWWPVPVLMRFGTGVDLSQTGWCGAEVVPDKYNPEPHKTCEVWKAEISTQNDQLLLKTRGAKPLTDGGEPVKVNLIQRFSLQENKLVEIKPR
jgi:hypothetical protein